MIQLESLRIDKITRETLDMCLTERKVWEEARGSSALPYFSVTPQQ